MTIDATGNGGAKVDIHSHFMPGGYLEAIQRENPYGARLKDEDGTPIVVMRDGASYDVPAPILDMDAKLAELTRLGFDTAVVSPPLTIIHYELGGQEMVQHVRMVNDGMAEVERASGSRLRGMALVPMQDPDFAIRELERASEVLGLRAAVICTNILGANLDEPEFRPVFRRAAELDMLLFVHAWFVTGAERLGRYHLLNTIGNPFDATIAIASIIFSGMLDEIPTLKICVGHAGGAAPYIVGRIDRGYEMREPARSAIPRPPSSYLSQLYYDTITHNEHALQFLVSTVGADRVLVGSDCPYQLVDMGDPRPLEHLDTLDVTPEERAGIAGGTALALIGAA